MYERILVDTVDGVCTLTLNKPETLNALDPVMREELPVALTRIAEDKAARVLVLTGAGRAFCSGGDITAMRTDQAAHEGRERLARLGRISAIIWNMEKPVIAAVNGACAGGGMGLALACDFVMAAKSAKFIQSFVKIGLIPDLGSTYSLARRVGMAKAKDMMMTGRAVGADEALAMGLADRVFDDAVFPESVLALARALARAPSPSLGLIKTLVNKAATGDFADALENEAYAQGLCYTSADFAEGRRAFLEKRAPVFGSVIS